MLQTSAFTTVSDIFSRTHFVRDSEKKFDIFLSFELGYLRSLLSTTNREDPLCIVDIEKEQRNSHPSLSSLLHLRILTPPPPHLTRLRAPTSSETHSHFKQSFLCRFRGKHLRHTVHFGSTPKSLILRVLDGKTNVKKIFTFLSAKINKRRLKKTHKWTMMT